jgi:hypothetical protein
MSPPTLYFFLLVLEKRNVMFVLLLLTLYLSLLLCSRLCYLPRSPHCIWRQRPRNHPVFQVGITQAPDLLLCFCHQQDLIDPSFCLNQISLHACSLLYRVLPNAKQALLVRNCTVLHPLTDTVSFFEAAHSHQHKLLSVCLSARQLAWQLWYLTLLYIFFAAW